MRPLLLSFCLLAFAAPSFAFQQPPLPNTLALFGRGTYPGIDSTYRYIRESGFNTMILSSFYFFPNGDVYSGDSTMPIIRNGKYVGDKNWLRRVASLKQQAPTSIGRIEILLEGKETLNSVSTYALIQNWVDSTKTYPGIVTGTGPNSTLYKICQIFKSVIGADAICIDDESEYDSTSMLAFASIPTRLNMHMTLCPYNTYYASFWKTLQTHSAPALVDFVYLQCYDGGIGNSPGQWQSLLSDTVPIFPILLCRGSFGTCSSTKNSMNPDQMKAQMKIFKAGYRALTGGAIWQMADVNSYIQMNCAIIDPESGTAIRVRQYLLQLAAALRAPQ